MDDFEDFQDAYYDGEDLDERFGMHIVSLDEDFHFDYNYCVEEL